MNYSALVKDTQQARAKLWNEGKLETRGDDEAQDILRRSLAQFDCLISALRAKDKIEVSRRVKKISHGGYREYLPDSFKQD